MQPRQEQGDAEEGEGGAQQPGGMMDMTQAGFSNTGNKNQPSWMVELL
jgi:hypothetical protein